MRMIWMRIRMTVRLLTRMMRMMLMTRRRIMTAMLQLFPRKCNSEVEEKSGSSLWLVVTASVG